MNDYIELESYKGHEPGLMITILKSADELIKKCEYNNEVEFLKIGEATYKKRLNKPGHFPLVFFTALEAKKFGHKIPCDYKEEIFSYYGLTCDPENLELIEKISFDEAIGCYKKVEKYRCPNCKKVWLIDEEYDSHHGTNRKCSIISE